jgi:hypothetical protein
MVLARSVSVALAFLSLSAQPARDERQLARELDGIVQRLDEERRTWRDAHAQAASDAERAELAEAFPSAEYVGELEALAAKAKGTDLGARAWLHVYRLGCLLGDRALFQRAIDTLTGEYLGSGETMGFTLELVYGAPEWGVRSAEDALRTILTKSTDENVRVNAMVQLALTVGQDAELGAKGREEAEALLARIEKEYGDEDFIGMTGKQFAAGARFEIDHLRVGQVAPDFEVTDQEGTRFQLSDYRGRVVVLDFWGFV